jgi:hypothetical protein
MIGHRLLAATAAIGFGLSGCAKPLVVTEPIEVQIVRYEPVPVPEVLLTPCRVTLSDLNTNQDLELALADALLELRRCSADKDAIRELE